MILQGIKGRYLYEALSMEIKSEGQTARRHLAPNRSSYLCTDKDNFCTLQ